MSVDNPPPLCMAAISSLTAEIWDYADPQMPRPDAEMCGRWAADMEMLGNRMRHWHERTQAMNNEQAVRAEERLAIVEYAQRLMKEMLERAGEEEDVMTALRIAERAGGMGILANDILDLKHREPPDAAEKEKHGEGQ